MFKAWPKIGRELPFNVIITEKMDGTNACIIIEDGKIIGVQSRKRMITPEDDNYGFAAWVQENTEELLKLGDGYHYGEWVGEGIQKNPHTLQGKHFYLFNTFRWNPNNPNLPECCSVVPVLFEGELQPSTLNEVMDKLEARYDELGGTPEGVIVYYLATRSYSKHTFKTPQGKWAKAS